MLGQAAVRVSESHITGQNYVANITIGGKTIQLWPIFTLREGGYQKIRHNADIDIAVRFQLDPPVSARCANFN
jgi:hypothetical protein